MTKILSLTQLFVLAALPLFAQDTKQQITTEALNMLEEGLNEFDFSSCLKQDRATLVANYKKSIANFFQEEGTMDYIKEEMEYAGSDAIYSIAGEALDFAQYQVLERSGVDEDDFYDCQAELMQNISEDYQSEADMMLTSAFAVPAGDIDVSLPVYEGSKLVSYLNREQSTQMLKQLYPGTQGEFPQAAIYASSDDFDKIVAFYADALDGFVQARAHEKAIAFSTETFDFSKLMTIDGAKTWAMLESVWIEKLDYAMPEGDVKIEIHWK